MNADDSPDYDRIAELAEAHRPRLLIGGFSAYSRRVDWAMGAAWLIRRSALERIGLLDERYFLYYEDVDLAYMTDILRLKFSGYGLRFRSSPHLTFDLQVDILGLTDDRNRYRAACRHSRSLLQGSHEPAHQRRPKRAGRHRPGQIESAGWRPTLSIPRKMRDACVARAFHRTQQ